MASTQGISAIGVYVGGAPAQNAATLAAILPNVDANRLTGSGSFAGGPPAAGSYPGRNNTYLDEMSPACAVQLQVELAAMAAADDGAQTTPADYGQYVAVAQDAANGTIVIQTGLATNPVLANSAVSIRRGGTLEVGYTLTSPGGGVLSIANGGGYVVTAGDVVTWIAQ